MSRPAIVHWKGTTLSLIEGVPTSEDLDEITCVFCRTEAERAGVQPLNPRPAALYVGKVPAFDDTFDREVLVTVWPDGTAEMALRYADGGSWSAPEPMERREVT